MSVATAERDGEHQPDLQFIYNFTPYTISIHSITIEQPGAPQGGQRPVALPTPAALTVGTSRDEPPSAEEYCQHGMSAAGLAHFHRLHGAQLQVHLPFACDSVASGITALCVQTCGFQGGAATTSDACHAIIKLLTVPSGWRCHPTVVNAEKRWYSHEYEHLESGVRQPRAPPGTCSYCELLLRSEETQQFVGRPNVFLSHAWLYQFADVVDALCAFAEAEAARGGEELFFWFDTFSIDEHATQTLPQEWWGTAFKDAISIIGHTVMLLAPWDKPVPLTRAWCLWELFCTVVVGAKFSVCLASAQEEAFRTALCDNYTVFLDALADINVAKAQAGSEQDRLMIMAAVEESGGASRLNALAMAEMRRWVKEVARGMAEASRDRGDLGTVEQVAHLLVGLGEHAEARALYEAAIQGLTEQLGEEHTDTLKAKMNLAILLKDLGERAEARPLYEEAVQGFTEQLGAEHTRTLQAKMNLALLLVDLGERAEARALYEAAIQGYTEQLGAEHTDTLRAKMNLAILLVGLGEHAEARALYEEAVQGRTEQLGAEHIQTLQAKMNLASLLQVLGERAEARALYEEAIQGYTEQLGAEHTHTLSAKEGLALLLVDLGERAEARALYEAAIQGYTEQLGAEHTHTLSAKMNLAILLVDLGERAEARALYEEAIQGRTEQLGAEHTDTLTAKMNLAILLVGLGERAEARALFEAVVQGFTEQFGGQHTHTLGAKMNLATLLEDLGEHAEARPLYEAVVQGFTEQLGAEHTHTLLAKKNLAILLKNLGE